MYDEVREISEPILTVSGFTGDSASQYRAMPFTTSGNGSSVVYNHTVFEGSPAYKRRRGRSRQIHSPSIFDPEIDAQNESPAHIGLLSDIRSATESPGLQYRNNRSGTSF